MQKQIKEALEKASNFDFFTDFASYFPNDTNAIVIQNAPEWLQWSLSHIEQLEEQVKELIRVNSVKSQELLEKDIESSSLISTIEGLKGEVERLKEQRGRVMNDWNESMKTSEFLITTIEELTAKLKDYEGCKGVEEYYTILQKYRESQRRVERYRIALEWIVKYADEPLINPEEQMAEIARNALKESSHER